jgi:HEAT repeat protein
MTSCPTCGKPVDSLRAPAVRVAAGKVVPYCSKECAAAAESQPVKIQPTKVIARPGTEPKPQVTAKKKTPPAGVPKSPEDLDSGPVIQIVHEPGSGVVTSASDPRSGRARSNPRAETDGAIQIADTGHIDDFVSYDDSGRSRILLVVLLLVLVVAAGGATAYYLGYFDKYLKHEGAAAATKTVEPLRSDSAEPVVIDAAPPLTPEVALERAKAVLREQMKSNSPRVQRVAASALARTSDAEAIELLAKALPGETTLNAKLDTAYALARGGDKRGVEALMAAASGDRESRHTAGQRLAALGDQAAVRTLRGSLEYSQFRLGVAEQLARFAEPKALKVLDDVRADEKATPDEKARATIALGHAGRTDVAPALVELLDDGRNNLFAAGALADLHDEAARPVLIKQLSIPSLRVQAARWLRRLAPGANVTDQLAPLLAALDNNRDTEQVQIAEAILLLAGPPAWSERE